MKTRPKYFYSDLATFDDLYVDLGNLSISESERDELLDIAHIHLHEVIIDTILSHLSASDKKKFLGLVTYGEDEKIWNHLYAKVEKIEEKISDTADQLKKELKEDIKNVKSQVRR